MTSAHFRVAMPTTKTVLLERCVCAFMCVCVCTQCYAFLYLKLKQILPEQRRSQLIAILNKPQELEEDKVIYLII